MKRSLETLRKMRQKTRESREKDRGVKEMRTERERMRGGK